MPSPSIPSPAHAALTPSRTSDTPPLAAAGPPVQPEAIKTDFTGTYPVKPAIPNRAL